MQHFSFITLDVLLQIHYFYSLAQSTLSEGTRQKAERIEYCYENIGPFYAILERIQLCAMKAHHRPECNAFVQFIRGFAAMPLCHYKYCGKLYKSIVPSYCYEALYLQHQLVQECWVSSEVFSSLMIHHTAPLSTVYGSAILHGGLIITSQTAS